MVHQVFKNDARIYKFQDNYVNEYYIWKGIILLYIFEMTSTYYIIKYEIPWQFLVIMWYFHRTYI